ncbi:MAG: hypothetical protein KJZ69_06065 [Phycisphaerales bacterium]|nr:hypothetical protein [Phycisphaerales bacterium]
MAGFEWCSRHDLHRMRAWTFAAAASALLSASGSGFAQRYEMRILEPPPEYGGIWWVTGINNRGDVLAWMRRLGTFTDLPALWRDGRFVELPLLDNGGSERRFAGAEGMNDQGQVVGFSDGLIWGQYAVFWPDDQTVINLLDRDSVAQEINDNGIILGDYAVATFSYKPFIWENGQWAPLWPALEYAPDINNLNQVVGDNGQSAVLWQNGEVTLLPSLRPGAQAGASAINDLGQIAGSSQREDEIWRPVVWNEGVVRELPRLMGYPGAFASPFSINMKGEIGGSNQVAFQMTHPVLWRNNLVIDLNDMTTEPHPDWEFQYGAHVNDAGQIAVRAWSIPERVSYAAVLNPVDTGLTVWGIAPARPGRRNTIQINHATPGGRVSLLWGTARAEPMPLQQCQGAMIEIADPRLAASAVAGLDGRAFVRINIPAQTEGNFILQVVDHRSCEVSPPAWTLIKAEN